jgi:hypothetical protein
LAEVTNLNYVIEQAYLRGGSNYYSDAKSPEEAKEKIREQYRRDLALTAARKKANTLLTDVFNLNPVTTASLAALAGSNGLTAAVTRPFDRMKGPDEFDGGPNFALAAFALTPSEPVSEQALVGEDSIFVIALDRELPSELPPLEQIRDRVAADYRRNQAVNLARMAGLTFARAFTNGQPPPGKTFAAVCADAKVTPVAVPPFSYSSTNDLPQVESHANVQEFKNAALVTSPGKVSEFVSTDEGGFVVYVERRLPVDEARMNAELDGFLARVRVARRQEMFNAWFNREGSRALSDILRREAPAARPGQSGS